jgi:hypothetical protein
MKIVIMLVCLLVLSGCGLTHYSISTPDGVEVSVWNTKDYESYELTAKKQPDNSWAVRLNEKGISASDPMKAMAQNLSDVISLIPAGGM